MKLVMAVVRPSRVEAVRQALAAVHVTRLSIADGQEFLPGPEGGIAQESILEIAVNDDFLSRTVDTIARCGGRGDERRAGAVYVVPIEQAVQIYRDVRGPEAV